jgi:hypothetical protein
MDVGVADAVEVGEHRHARIGLHPRDQALAAARHDHVDQARRRQHRADRRAVLRRHSWTAAAGTPQRPARAPWQRGSRGWNATASLPPRSSTALPEAGTAPRHRRSRWGGFHR